MLLTIIYERAEVRYDGIGRSTVGVVRKLLLSCIESACVSIHFGAFALGA
jgi:hypothetical protein